MYSDIRAQYNCMQYIFKFKLNYVPHLREFSIFIQNTNFNAL